RTMLRLEGRGRCVRLVPLTRNGVALRDWIASRFSGRADIQSESGALLVRFPEPPAGHDEQTRLKLPSPLDLVRAIALELRLVSEPAPQAHLAAGVFAYALV